MMKYIHWITLAAVALVLTVTCTNSPAGTLATPYTHPAQFTSFPFGSYSHWLQPWRAYLETVPATTFLKGIGICWDLNSKNPELLGQMLSKHGIRRARVEISWNHIDFDDETKVVPSSATNFRAQLLALKKYGIRPLILLNAHHGAPGPIKLFERTLAADARAGDTTVQLNDASGLTVGYSGLSYLNDDKAAGWLITNIAGNTLTLSKPLPKDIKAGTSIPMATLKYRPFSPPDTEDYKTTMGGWQRYVGTVAKFVADVLGTTQSSDKGFDMEIWNELSFGSYFLFINSYYVQKPYKYNEDSIFGNLIKETAAYVDAHPADFQGVLFSDGLANTIPWPASSTNPVRITAISKHLYNNRTHYPKGETNTGTNINALYQEDKSGFIPSYSILFPEHSATALRTESTVRDIGPITSEVNGTKHGRNARVINGVVVPNPVWLTEVNISPVEDDPNITAERALALKAKTTARYFCFYLNKGVTQVYLFAAADKDKALGIVKESFLHYAEQPNAVYPTDDTPYISPTLAVTKRIIAKMSQQVDPNLTNTRQLQVVSISDTHDHYQFAGDGTAAHPNLYNRDVFAFLPYQINARRFIIPYYVMTRDVMKDLPPEQFTVQIKGIKGEGASVTAYDPINDRDVPLVVNGKGPDTLSVKLTATDYPYLLTVQETQ
jgi:hypothetical protein